MSSIDKYFLIESCQITESRIEKRSGEAQNSTVVVKKVQISQKRYKSDKKVQVRTKKVQIRQKKCKFRHKNFIFNLTKQSNFYDNLFYFKSK